MPKQDTITDPRTGFVVSQAPQAIAIPGRSWPMQCIICADAFAGGGAAAIENSALPKLLEEDEDEVPVGENRVQSFEIDPEQVMVWARTRSVQRQRLTFPCSGLGCEARLHRT